MITEKFIDLFDFEAKSKIKAGVGLSKGTYPFYTSSSTLKKWIDKAQFFNDSLIFGTGGSASIHFAQEHFSVSTDCLVAVAKKDKLFNAKFVYYYIFGNIQILEQGFRGAGLKHISKSHIQKLEIPLPELEIQNKIVAILDKVKILIEKKEKSITLHDDLLTASFLNMFGDPFFNPKKFETNILENTCSFITKGTTPKNINILSEPFEDCVPFLKVYHIADDTINFKYKPSYISKKIHNNDLNRSKVKPNDILMNIVGPPLGKIGLVPDTFNEWNTNQAIVIFRPKEGLLPSYLLSVLKSKTFLKSIIVRAVGVRQQNISLKQCREIEIPVPPIDLQLEYENIFFLNKNVKEKIIQSKVQLEYLLKALSQSAFKGELKFNTAVDLEVLMEKDYEFFKKNSDYKAIELLLERFDKDELNTNKFYEQELYDKAKGFVFELLKEGKVKQFYDAKSNRIKLKVK